MKPVFLKLVIPINNYTILLNSDWFNMADKNYYKRIISLCRQLSVTVVVYQASAQAQPPAFNFAKYLPIKV